MYCADLTGSLRGNESSAEIGVNEFDPVVFRHGRSVILLGVHIPAVVLNNERRIFLLEVFDQEMPALRFQEPPRSFR